MSKYIWVFIASATMIFCFTMMSSTPKAFAQQTVGATDHSWDIRSPNEQLDVKVFQKYSKQNKLYYQVKFNGKTVLEPSQLGVEMKNEAFVDSLDFVNMDRKEIRDSYTIKTGKQKNRHYHHNEMTLTFKNKDGEAMKIIFRASNDGFAYRYQFAKKKERKITSETSEFNLPSDAKAWMQPYDNNYEAFYEKGIIGEDFESGEFGFPSLVQTGDGLWVLLSESALDGSYAAGRMTAIESQPGNFSLTFPDGPITSESAVKTPWRVAMVGDKLETIVESTLVDDLSPSSKFEDTNWIKPGRVAWSWWSDGGSPGSLETQKDYVDFAAELGWEYVLVDAGWNPDWVPELVDYADQKNVDILLWSAWTDLDTEKKREEKLSKWKSWGVKGIKVDYMDDDSQDMMKFYDNIIDAAYKNQLMINLHGATIPRGKHRTWPNLMTREGVFGAEQRAHNVTTHNTTLPFTRNVVGPMDYTPVTFSADSNTTDAHELALSVAFQSGGWQHFADSNETYLSQPHYVRDFLKEVPVSWDKTKFIDGYPGEYSVIARKNKNSWYVGAINGTTSRKITVPLEFLKQGKYIAQIFQDGEENSILYREKEVTSDETLSFSVPKNGGVSIRIVRPEQDHTLGVNLSADGPSWIQAGDTGTITATITNNDWKTVQDVNAKLQAPKGWKVKPTSETSFNQLPSTGEKQVTWEVSVPSNADPRSAKLMTEVSLHPKGSEEVSQIDSELSVKIPPIAPTQDGYLSDHPWMKATAGWKEVQRDQSIDGNPITLNGQTYKKGIGTHAPSKIDFFLDGNFSTFESDIGVDEEKKTEEGSVGFEVWGDGNKLYESDVMTDQSPAQHLNIDIEGVDVLSLVANDGSDGKDSDHADWADAKIKVDTDQTPTEFNPKMNGEDLQSKVTIPNTEIAKFAWDAENAENELEDVYATFDGESYKEGTTVDLAGKPGKHELVLTAIDEEENVTVKSYEINVTTSAADMKTLVERFEDQGDFKNEQAAHALKLHLIAVSHYEGKDLAEKVVKHMKGFKVLLDQQKEKDSISKEAYKTLNVDTEYMIKKWQEQ